jgi:hypothetical protein
MKGYYVALASKKRINDNVCEKNANTPKVQEQILIASRDTAPVILTHFSEHEAMGSRETKDKKQFPCLRKESVQPGDPIVSKERRIVKDIDSFMGTGRSKEKYFLFFSVLFSAFTGGMTLFGRNKATQLSCWAKNNKWKARTTLTGIHVARASTGFFAGNILSHHELFLSEYARNIFIASFLSGTLCYPVKRLFVGWYVRGWLCDLVLSLSGFLLAVYTGYIFAEERTRPLSSG